MMQPPLPPEIAAQQQPEPDPRQSAFAPPQGQPGQPGGESGPAQVIQQIQSKVQELDSWAGSMKNLLGSFDPSLLPYLQQIGKIAVDMLSAVQTKAQRSGAATGSPTVAPQPPQNPAAGPPNPNA